MSTRYLVTFDDYTKRHYIKKFEKDYSERVWRATETAIRALCENLEETLKTEKLETISQHEHLKLCKLYFAVAGTKKSAKASGCRGIVVVDGSKKWVRILLVYHKQYIVRSGNETVAWKKVVAENFPEYKHLLN